MVDLLDNYPREQTNIENSNKENVAQRYRADTEKIWKLIRVYHRTNFKEMKKFDRIFKIQYQRWLLPCQTVFLPIFKIFMK